jgi:hypothetical protein
MRNTLGIVGLGLAFALSGTAVGAQVDEELWWDDDGLDYFHTAVSDYYDVPVNAPPPPSYLHPDELPVVYLLAREARVSPEVVMALREMGWSWMDITHHLGVDPYVYVSRLPRRSGYWGWHGVRDYRYLTDRHIIDYVNLVFWADYYRRPVTHVIVIRQRVPTWFYYVRYYAPPRVVYVRNPVRWAYTPTRRGDSGRRSEPVRRAEPRAGTATQGTRTATRPATQHTRQTQPSRAERSATPSRPTSPAARPAQPSRPTEASRPAQGSRPTAQPSRPAPGSRPAAQSSRPAQGSRPAAQPSRPAQGSRPAAQPSRPAQGSRPAAQPSRPAQNSRPAAQPSRPAQGSRPAAQPSRPAQNSRPAAQPWRPAQNSRPAAQSSRPSAPSRPAAQRPSSGSRETVRSSGSSRTATSPRRPSRPGG